MPFSLFFALRSLVARRGYSAVVSFFALIGILIGVAALIVIMAVMAGLKQELHSRMLGVNGHVLVSQFGMTQNTAADYAEAISKNPSITEISIQAQGQGLATHNGRAAGIMVKGVENQGLPPQIAKSLTPEATLAWENNADALLIGQSLAKQLNARIGSKITLVAPQGTPTPFGFMPRYQRATVAGIYDSGLNQYDSVLIYIPIKKAQGLLQLGERISHITLTTTDATTVDKTIEELQEILPLSVQYAPWTTLNRAFFEALEVERVAMFLILSLVVVVAAFNIITGQMMLVRDKVSDIAIMRACGATQGQVLRLFFMSGSLLGVIGTFLGSLSGVYIVLNLQKILNVIESFFGVKLFSGEAYFLDTLPAVLNVEDMLITIGLALVLTLLASLLPAWHASRLQPVTLLKQDG
jgi:lipoprotein-releasing system permease protein